MADSELSDAERRFGLEPGAFPFQSHFIENRGVKLHYVDVGIGPTLLMIHGNPTWSFIYRHLIRELSVHYRCIALDCPGFGLSSAPDDFSYEPADLAEMVEDLLIARDLQDVTLVAHDWGGPIGIAAALRSGGRITRLCLGNSWAWPVNGDFHFEWFSRLMGGPIGRFGTNRFAMFINLMIPASMKRGRLSDATMRAYRAPFANGQTRRPMIVLPQQILKARQWLAEIESGLHKFSGPVRLIWPENDIAFRAKELRRWQAMLPQADVVSIPNCGHYLWEDAPEECAAAVREFMEVKA